MEENTPTDVFHYHTGEIVSCNIGEGRANDVLHNPRSVKGDHDQSLIEKGVERQVMLVYDSVYPFAVRTTNTSRFPKDELTLQWSV